MADGAGLPQTKLGTYLENRVNSFLKRKDTGAGEVTIRVLSSSDKVVEVRPGMKAKFCTPGMLSPSPTLAWVALSAPSVCLSVHALRGKRLDRSGA